MAEADHILLIEKDKSLQHILTLMFRQARFRVSIAEDGIAGYRRICENLASPVPVSLLVADIHDPDLGCGDLLSRLAEEAIDLPVITITGHGEGEGWQRPYLGCDGICSINKPFEPHVLMECVATALAGSALPAGAVRKEDGA